MTREKAAGGGVQVPGATQGPGERGEEEAETEAEEEEADAAAESASAASAL